MSPIKYELGADRVVTITFDALEASVNTMSEAWKNAFSETVERLEKEKASFDGVILASAKKTFFAGAELKDVVKLTASDGPRMFHEIEAIKADFRKLEKLGKPVVAALAGTALGGGFEIALAAHCRICVDDPKIQLGFPEVTLGLIPGAGGVTKLTRLLGLQAAFPYLIEGKLMRPADAAKLGLLQGLAKDAAGAMTMAREWIKANPAPVQPWDAKDYRMPGGNPNSPQVSQMLAVAPAMLSEKTRGLYPAPEAILSAMVEGAYVDFDTAMRIESRYLAKVAVGQVAKNMITAFFFNMTAIKSGASRPEGHSEMEAREGRHPRRRHDGRRDRLRDGDPRHRLRAEGCLDGGGRKGQRLHREDSVEAQEGARTPRPDHADGQRRRPCRLRPDHRGRVREARTQGAGDEGVRTEARAGRHLCVQHFHAADHGTGQGICQARELHRPAFLFARGPHAAGRDHQGRENLARDDRAVLRLCAGDRQDPDRGQRLARLLHQPHVRHLRDGGLLDVVGRDSPGSDRERGAAGRACRSGRSR